jgi:membrane-associated protein
LGGVRTVCYWLANFVGGSGTKGLVGLLTLVAAFVLAWYGAPLFRKNEIAVSRGQYVYGTQPSEWGRGSGDSTRSGIWVMGLLLNRLARIPGIYVFHGLKSPGDKMIDVEHAVTHGNNVYLIDSWLDRSTNYNWHPNRKGLATSSKGDDGHRHTNIADAADRYRAALGRGVNVIPIIAIASGTASIGPERWSPRGVGLFTADEVLRFIGDGAVENLPTFRDRPEVREAVASTVEIFCLVFAEDALFVGFVIPGETAAVLGGVVASRGEVQLPVMMTVAVVAAVLGDTVGYEVGKHLGPRLVKSKAMTRHKKRIKKAQDFLRRRGGWAVFLGRFVAFFRAVMPALAGTSRMPYARFLLFNAAGGLTWGIGFVLLGYFAGNSYAAVAKAAGRDIAVVVAAVAVAALVARRLRAWKRERA